MKTIVAGILMATVSLVTSPSASQAQTVRDTSNGQESFEREVKTLCGATAHVIVGQTTLMCLCLASISRIAI